MVIRFILIIASIKSAALVSQRKGLVVAWGRCHRPGEKVGKNGWIVCVFLIELFKSGLDRRCVRVGGKDRPTGIAPWGLGTTAGRDLLAGLWVIKQSDFS